MYFPGNSLDEAIPFSSVVITAATSPLSFFIVNSAPLITISWLSESTFFTVTSPNVSLNSKVFDTFVFPD